MQINRLFEIVYILLDKKTVTAKELADRFEVSSRTIYRDVETLSSAGIPIFMSKGKGGGISLLPEFVLNKAILSEEEKSEVLSALQSLNAVNSLSINNTLSKFSSLFGGINDTSWIEIDYSDWSNMKRDQFEIIKQAIVHKTVLSFDYYNRNSEFLHREIEPLTLWFKEKTWYLKAYCRMKQDFRIFKLTRMKNVVSTNEHFSKREIVDMLDSPELPMIITKITVKIDASQSYRVYDDFDDEDVKKDGDGNFIVTMDFVEDQWVYGYLLSFGFHAEVIEPPHIRNIIKEHLQKSLNKYL